MRELYRRIWTVTWRPQLVLIGLSIFVAAMAAAPLQYQKDIVNGLAGDMQSNDLLRLGFQFLGVLLLSSAAKFALNYRSALVSERVIRRIRGRICADAANEEADQEMETGTLVTIISTEAEEVGKFVGNAIASPLLQIGILVSVITFIAATQPYLGLLLIAVILPQAIIVVSIQKHVNARVARRVKVLRRATNSMSEEDIRQAQKSILADFDQIYEARRSIYLFKQTSKFALNAITGIGTAGILVLGGWLALQGRTDVGSIVAALSGLARISPPWRELIAFYRELSAVRIKFELLESARSG